MEKKSITIIGAGLVGSLCALYFARRGYAVTVFERRPDLRTHPLEGGRSINLALSHRGITALQQVNVSEKILAEAVPMFGRCVHDLTQQISFQPYSFHEHEFNYSVSRERLNRLLLDELDTYSNVKLVFEKNVILDDIKKLSEENADRETPIVVADGASSHIRKELQQLNTVNFSEIDSEHAYKELSISAEHGKELQKNYLHIWPRQQFMLIALPNFDGTFTCTLFMPTSKFAELNTEEKILIFFQENFSEVVRLMPDLLQQYNKNPVGALKSVQGSPWCVKDKIVFIGDAAHAMLPFLGQGMNCGFEDCQILNSLLDHYHDDIALAFKNFSEARKLDTDAITQLSLENYLEMRHKVIDAAYLKKREIEQQLVKKFPQKYRPIYELISYTNLPYSDILRLKIKREKLLERLVRRN